MTIVGYNPYCILCLGHEANRCRRTWRRCNLPNMEANGNATAWSANPHLVFIFSSYLWIMYNYNLLDFYFSIFVFFWVWKLKEGFHVASESLASIYFSFDQIKKSFVIGPLVKTKIFLSWIRNGKQATKDKKRFAAILNTQHGWNISRPNFNDCNMILTPRNFARP